MITRFAPSPTGPLHLGHAYSAILAHDMARKAHGKFILRIEDLDKTRARPDWEAQIFEDLRWLGLNWDGPVIRQSERLSSYKRALDRLGSLELLYPCTCTRRDISEALDAPQEGVETGFDGPAYPGTCRDKTNIADDQFALRLNMKKALDQFDTITFSESLNAPSGIRRCDREKFLNSIGDIVIARKDIGASYHLAVVVDDAEQGVTDIVRGEDLLPATPIHCLLQDLLGFSRPNYHHHKLIRDDAGKRLAKRDDARSIRTYRDGGVTPGDIRNMLEL